MARESDARPRALAVLIEGGRVLRRVPAADLETGLEVLAHHVGRRAREGRSGDGPWLARVECGGEVWEVEIRRRPGGRQSC